MSNFLIGDFFFTITALKCMHLSNGGGTHATVVYLEQ